MTAALTTEVSGTQILCTITSDVDLSDPVFCFSLLAPVKVLRGGDLIRSVGGYGEVRLPDILAGIAATVTVAYADDDFRPANRAWLPLGPYLRHADGIIELPAGPAGAKPWQPSGPITEPDLRLVPPPDDWRPDGGVTRITRVASGDAQLAQVDRLARRTGFAPFLDPDGVPVAIRRDGSLAGSAYQLEIANDRVEITAADAAGLFYAGITLLQLIQTYQGDLPTGRITDAPRFPWRGQHLDCARHFYQPETLLRFLDLMALFKLNRFHWHFADDEAFRLQIDALPALWRQTQIRGEERAIPGVFGGGAGDGGSYSKAFAGDLIARARELHIEVMPEIEVPAHALALNAVIPGLRDPDDSGDEASVQGYAGNTINPAMPRTWEVLEAIVTEVAEIFPFEFIHLGCDELPAGTWAGSPAVTDLKAREGLQTTDDVQGWMMQKLARFVVGLGKKPAAWEEAARGSNGALLFSWSGQGPGIAAAKAGYDVVMCPAQHVYLDMAQSDEPDDWGANWAATPALSETVAWQPVPAELGENADRIKGVQGAFWSEFTTRDDEMNDMIWPRVLGVASMAWSAQASAMDSAAIEGLAQSLSKAGFNRLLLSV